MKLTKKKIYILAGGALLLIVAALLVFRRKATAASMADMPAPNEPDHRILVQYFKDYGNPEALHWLLEIAEEYLADKRPWHQNDLIQGKKTKAGAFFAAWATSYYGYGYKYKIPEKDFRKGMFQRWYALPGVCPEQNCLAI